MIIAILIGRLGSAGFPGKNTTPLLGHPLAWWPLDAVRRTPEIDAIYVSTDDPEIAEIGNEMGAHLITRPASLATKEALGEDVYVHAHQEITKSLGEQSAEVELYVLLMANSVTVSANQLSEGIKILRDRPDLDSAVTVSCYNMWSPLRARKINANGLLEPFVPFHVFGDPAALNCDRDSQGDVWFADMGASVVRPENLSNVESGLLPQKWMGQRIYPIKNNGGLDVDFHYQLPQAQYWLEHESDREPLD